MKHLLHGHVYGCSWHAALQPVPCLPAFSRSEICQEAKKPAVVCLFVLLLMLLFQGKVKVFIHSVHSRNSYWAPSICQALTGLNSADTTVTHCKQNLCPYDAHIPVFWFMRLCLFARPLWIIGYERQLLLWLSSGLSLESQCTISKKRIKESLC